MKCFTPELSLLLSDLKTNRASTKAFMRQYLCGSIYAAINAITAMNGKCFNDRAMTAKTEGFRHTAMTG